MNISEMSDTTVKLTGFTIAGDGASYNIHGQLESVTLTAEQAQRAGERLIALEKQVADLETQLAEARRHNELLRAVAEAADFMAWCYVDQAEESEQIQLRQALQSAIDGGACLEMH